MFLLSLAFSLELGSGMATQGARGEGGKGRGGKGGGKSNHRHVASNLNIQSWSAGKDTLNVSYF